MKNIATSIKKNILTITIDLTQDFGLSSSGKSITVASTSGNISIPGTDVKLGVNAYKAAPKA